MVCPIGQLRGNQVKVLNSPAAVSLYLNEELEISFFYFRIQYDTKTTELRRENSTPL